MADRARRRTALDRGLGREGPAGAEAKAADDFGE